METQNIEGMDHAFPFCCSGGNLELTGESRVASYFTLLFLYEYDLN